MYLGSQSNQLFGLRDHTESIITQKITLAILYEQILENGKRKDFSSLIITIGNTGKKQIIPYCRNNSNVQ